MKKIALLILLLIGLSYLLKSQTVDNIKVEQAGDFIKVRYQIMNSNANQVFKVTVLCSINGGLESVLKSLSGDFGDNVVGGRAEYMVLWDVLKDVDEVKSVDFSIKAELIKDSSLPNKSGTKALSDRKIHVFLVAGGPGPKYGGKIGYMGSWGITAMYLAGKEDNSEITLHADSEESVFSIGLDVTKRIINAKKFNLHLFAGLNVSKLLVHSSNIDDTNVFFSNCIGYEGGLIMSINRLAFSFCINAFDEDWTKDGVSLRSTDKVYEYIGIGYRF